MDFDRSSLRHAVATLGSRAAKTMRGAPDSFADCKPGPDTKTPVEIVAHMGDLFDWGLRMALGEPSWTTATPLPWPDECARFFVTLKAFDDYLASDAPVRYGINRVFWGPVADH